MVDKQNTFCKQVEQVSKNMGDSMEQTEAGSRVISEGLGVGGVGLASGFLTSELSYIEQLLYLFKFHFLYLENGNVSVDPPGT